MDVGGGAGMSAAITKRQAADQRRAERALKLALKPRRKNDDPAPNYRLGRGVAGWANGG